MLRALTVGGTDLIGRTAARRLLAAGLDLDTSTATDLAGYTPAGDYATTAADEVAWLAAPRGGDTVEDSDPELAGGHGPENPHEQ